MAFNPFSNFRKYRTFWMATILLLCMGTFVLCTGFGQGDLSDLLLRIFRSKGQAWAKLDGSNIYSGEFHDLKDRRNAANEFMRTASKVCMARMDEELKPENLKKSKDNPKEQEALMRVQQLRHRLDVLNRKPRFFDSGVKADELLDFKIWLAEADRLGIDLSNEVVMSLVHYELTLGHPKFFAGDVYKAAALEVRRNYQRATEAMVTSTLRDEFRARLAQRVLAAAGESRLALTPAQVWDIYKEKRVEYKISLLPLQVEDFVKDVKTPDDEALRIFFEQYAKQTFDPASPTPGFAIPNRVKVAWISGDANSDYFKKLSKLAIELQTAPPLPGPQWPGLSFIISNLAKIGAAQDQFENHITRGQFRMVGPLQAGANLTVADYLAQRDPHAFAALIGAGARLDAGIATLPNFWAAAILRHPKEFKAGTEAVLRKRIPLYATLTMLGSTHQGLAIPLAWDHFYLQSDFLPLSLIQDEILETVQRRQAEIWVQKHMQAIRKDLDKIASPTSVQIQTALNQYLRKQFKASAKTDPKAKQDKRDSYSLKDIGLEQGETKELYSKFTIENAKELEPLKKSYLAYYQKINNAEGRSLTPETQLKSDDFWKLFFSEAGEPFSATGKYQIRPWPPAVTINAQQVQAARLAPQSQRDLEIAQMAANMGANEPLVMQFFNDAERPFLFWRTDDKPGGIATDWKEVRDQVIAAWKLDKARDKIVLPRAQKIAEQIQKNTTPVLTMQSAMEDLKKEFGVKREIISLGSRMEPVSPQVPVMGGDGRGGVVRVYKEFSLPAGLINYPRKDTPTQLLGLYDLKKELTIDYPALDNINKTLYNEISRDKNPQGKFVQILTNQPRDAFYVAVVIDAPAPSHIDFNQTVLQAFGHDRFFDQSLADAGKRMRDDLMRQLRRAHDLSPPSDEVRKSFDHDTTN